MRLVCPNCGAQYEVPDEVIPTGGRDVQCSNCGDTWFQQHPSAATPSGEDEKATSHTWEQPQKAPAPSEPMAPEEEPPLAESTEAPNDDGHDQPQEPAPVPQTAPTGRRVDPGVADILRQEAEHEQKARASESATGLETQPDLGLSDPPMASDERSQQARARMERLRGGTPEPEGATASDVDIHADIDPSSRRNLLPDIEEINSSLTSANDRDEPVAAPIPEDMSAPVRRGGFGTGFRLAVVIFVLGTLAYVFAPQIAQMLPSAEAPLTTFVEMVNLARLGLNELITMATTWLAGMSAPSTGG